MQQTPKPSRRVWKRRALSLLLALVMVLGLVPVFPVTEAAAHWADTYLSQLVEWGFIRADQANNPDRALTRADFMAIVNRAYGYHEEGETPFEDIKETDWFYDDVGIAYTARYIKGTSPTTASPNNPLTRETAATILGRNMMLQESPGELVDFSDAHQISTWASGTIKSSLEHYLIGGYNDGTFRPKRNVSWGEMASMLTSLVGTPLQEPGEYSLGGVYGNVTITSPDVKLRDTVISGDLYISGGVGLGGIELENVTVLGRIVACGTGQAEGGQASILLRNVTADELLVDNLQDHYVSLRADGITEIGRTTVRTSAYIEDNTPDGLGLHYISLEGESYPEGEEPEDWVPIQLDLAGRIEEVVNRTPRSQVRVGAGTVAKLTVDETAEGSSVIIDRGAVVKELNLDTATPVTGQGDIEHLTVNAPGCEVEMLPDKIDIRPGITAIIAGEEMDTVGAKESSELPMILAGYPEAQDIVPTGLDAAFMTNKAGTVYWAVTAITDGSVGEEDLIKPPSYGNIAVRNGSVKVLKGNEETISKVTGLTPGGSYYLSAILVDARGQRSTVKVIAFTTPDNTTPAFCAGYPKMSKVSRTDSVVVVMPNKDCKLYYALLPEGATAPTENELKTSSVSGALGYGVRDVTKNVEDTFRVNDVILDETTTYVLYLWLTDADGVNKGKITNLKFTTDDETPPEFIAGPTQVKTQTNSVGMEFQLSEDGTVYWVAVPAGTQYPKPEPGTSYETAPLNSDYAILQVVSGMNLGAEGKSGKVNAKVGTNVSFNISGLKPESVYDLYYVAKDNAGPDRNYSVTVKKMTINTLDGKAPVFTQSFSNTSDGKNPRVNTDIYIDVSEDILYLGQNGGISLLELYGQTLSGTASARAQAVGRLAANLRNSIVLHKYDVQTRREESINLKYQTDDTRTDWVVDYTQVKVESRREGGIRITFPSSGLQLENGGQYCFIINDLADTSNARNPVEPDTGVDFWNYERESKAAGHNVPVFVVDLPVVNLDTPVIGSEGPVDEDGNPIRIDMSFYMEPVSTSTMSNNIAYDVLLWSRSTMSYDLYYRIVDHNGNVLNYEENEDIMLANTSSKISDADDNGWMYLGNSDRCVVDEKNPNGPNGWAGRSLSAFFNGCDASQFAQLNKLSENHHYQFVISLTEFNNWGSDYRTWDDTARMEINVAAGQAQNLDQLAGISKRPTHERWLEDSAKGIIRGVQSIGNWQDDNNQFSDTQKLEREFNVSTVPPFTNNTPEFIFGTNGDVSINLNLKSNGTVHYAIAEVDSGSKRPTLTTIRELMPGTSDYTTGEDGTTKPSSNVQMTGSGNGMYITTDPDLRPPVKSGNINEDPMPDWMIGGYPDNTTDDPEKPNKIIEPSNLLIVQNKWQKQVVDSGTFTPQEGINDAVTSDKVKPNTTYFAYFVITSVDDYSNMSHVYIYQFTTPEARKPAVLHEPESNGDVTMSIDVASTSGYRIITSMDALDPDVVSFLNQPFAKYTDHTGNVGLEDGKYGFDAGKNEDKSIQDKTPKDFLVYGDGSPVTVLDALTTFYTYRTASISPAPTDLIKDDPSYPEYYYPDWGGNAGAYAEGYTVFDMYANNAARDHLYNFILQGKFLSGETANVSGNPIADTKFSTAAPKKDEDYAETLLKTSDKVGNSRYLILTYSINPKMVQPIYPSTSSQNTSYIATFHGTFFQKGEMKAPEVDSASGSIQRDGSGGTYKGRFYIHFDKDTYLMDVRRPVKMTKTNLLSGVQEDLKPSESFGSGTVTVSNIYGSTAFDVNFSGVKVDDTFIFPNKYFSNENGDEADKTLEISVKRKTDGIYLVITWPGAKDSPWEIKMEEEAADYDLRIKNSTSKDPTKPYLDLTVGGSKTVTAAIDPPLEDNETEGDRVFGYTWMIKKNSDASVIDGLALSGNLKENAMIKGLIPGRTIVVAQVTATAGGVAQNLEKEMQVTVTGKLDPLADPDLTSGAFDEASGNTSASLALYTGTGRSPSATFTLKANGESPSKSAVIRTTTLSGVTIAPDDTNGTITITPTKSNGTASGPIQIWLAAEDGTELTDRVTLRISVGAEPSTATASINKAPAATPSLTLSGTKLKASGSNYTLTLDSSNSWKEAVTATVKNVSGTVTWKSSDKTIATVSPDSGNSVTITGVADGTATITATIGSLEKRITVTVKSPLTISSFTANSSSSTLSTASTASSAASTIKKGTDGTYTWTRKSGTSCAATLKFTTGLSMANATVTVTSSDPKAVSVGKVTKSGKTGSVQLTFGAMNKSAQVTITVKVGTATQSFKINLVGSDVSVLNLATK